MCCNKGQEVLLTLGKTQIDEMFARQWKGGPVDDSEFMPLVEVVLTAFETADIAEEVADELWEYTFDLYDKTCKEAMPDSPSKENRQLMQSYLLGERRLKRR